MKARSLYDRKSLLRILKKDSLQLSCDYYIEVSSPFSTEAPQYLILKDFKLPNAQLQFNNNQTLGHLSPAMHFDKLNLTFYLTERGESIIHRFWQSQFYNGVPRFIPFDQLPVVKVFRLKKSLNLVQELVDSSAIISLIQGGLKDGVSVDAVPIIAMNGCRFTYPTPSVNLQEDAPTEYITEVSFETFDIYNYDF